MVLSFIMFLTILHVLLCVVVSVSHSHVPIDDWILGNSWRIIWVPS